ncbi:MAG: beta-mannosidase [Fibrobacter sp.]|uniref:glycosyl hydrolase n=1 Tax=Fibrobacter sp. TaxID=35828 RepID=UPI0025C5598D|nr:glycosyl hydrolase [Fibrobacter sp.]MBS7272110.1 beta-mannosidase [Fibrobacter sp.]
MNFTKTILAFGLAAAATASAAQYEAENATLSGDAASGTSTEASGGKYVKMNGGDITFSNVSIDKAGQYTITIHYMNNYGGDKINNVEVGGTSSQVSFPVTEKGKFTDVETVLALAAGENTIAITNSWGWIDVDYIDVSPYQAKAFDLCNAPVTKTATPSAVKLYNFLVNNFGKKTISGVMTGNMDYYTMGDATQHEDVQTVYKYGGKYPALVGVDLMNATGANKDQDWFKEYTAKTVDIAKSIWAKGGIPAITWHWRPGEEVEFYTVNGNKTNNTDFDFSTAFLKGTTTWDTLSTAYKAITGDIDLVSEIFLDLQKAGVAAIFRPLHESGGNWFWWSTNTGKQFAALYQLVYERMVFKNGVNNLVWDFNPQDASKISWTPGETYYDVLSVDIYNKANDHQSNSAAFIDFTNKGGTNKIISLSENGPIPDVDNMYNEGATWSWWMPWYDSWGSDKHISQTSASVWQKNLADERIITLDEMPGWDNYNEAASATKVCATSTANAKYGAGSAEEVKNLMMAVTYTALNDSGANIELQKVPNLTGAKTVSIKITNNGSGGADNGIWVGLAFVRNGMKDDAWTWEMSTSTGCWINDGATTTCEFDITKYEDDDKVEHPIDLDNLFSVTLMVAAVGFEGTVIFDDLVADNGKVISAFDKKTELFTAATQSKGHIAKIELVDETGKSAAIKPVAAASAAAKLSVSGKTVSLTTAKAGMVAVEVFGMNGKRVATLYKGNLAAGTSAFSLADMPKGRYIVRVKGAGLAATQPILVK